jgi:M6 family metalloprotease-like protein
MNEVYSPRRSVFAITMILFFSSMVHLIQLADVHSELEKSPMTELLSEDTWDFGVGARYTPGSASIDSVEKVIVILAETTDMKFDNSKSYFEQLLFGSSWNTLRGYYDEVSYGTVVITGQVVGPVRLSHSLYYYDNSDEFSSGTLAEGIAEAIDIADSQVDFGPFDQNGDGVVDNFLIIFPGESDAANGDADNDGNPHDSGVIWPHKSSIPSKSTSDGVSISKYFTCPEACLLGTYTHEISHNFGLPDLYDYGSDGTDSEGIGKWGLMGSGNHLYDSNGNSIPAHLSAWSKQELRLVTPTVVPIGVDASYTLSPASTSQDILRVDINPDEYYLIEFRSTTASNYDSLLFSSGILIWHIDESVCRAVHRVNDDENQPCVRLIQADGDMDLQNNRNRGDVGDVWLEGSSFNKQTWPRAVSNQGNDVDIQLTITRIGSTFAVVHFGSFTAWFYDITATVQDSNGDGFKNEILFEYDPDTDGSVQDIMVVFEFYTGDRQVYTNSFYYNHTIQGSELDAFEADIGYYTGYANSLWWIEVRLWTGDSMTELKVFGNIWIEYPSTSNTDDDWLNDVSWRTIDTTGDGSNDSLEVDFEILSDSGFGTTGDVYLEVYSDENVSDRFSLSRTDLDLGYHNMIIAMRDSNLPPGILRARLILYVDSQREHISSELNLNLWWNAVRFNMVSGSAFDLDENGVDDSIKVRIDIDHSFRTDTHVVFEVNAWNQSNFDGFPSIQQRRNLILGNMVEGGEGGRGGHLFWLYAEWNQSVFIEVRAILPDGSDFTETIYWDNITGTLGFNLQSLDWPVTAWMTDSELLDNDGDGDEDTIRVRYDFDSVSPALEVAVELLAESPSGLNYSIWDNYTIEGDAYDIRTMIFSTWVSGLYEFKLRVHDLEQGVVEYTENLGSHVLSSAFDPPSLQLDRSTGEESLRGSPCVIQAELTDPVGDFLDQRGELEWSGVPFEPVADSRSLDCSQWPEGIYDISAAYVNGLGLFIADSVRVIVIIPVTPTLTLDESSIADVAGAECTIMAQASVDSNWDIIAIERIEWLIGDSQTPLLGDAFDCSTLAAGVTHITVTAYATGGTSTTSELSLVLMPDPENREAEDGIELSPKDDVETKSWGVIVMVMLAIIALLVPLLLIRGGSRSRQDEVRLDSTWDSAIVVGGTAGVDPQPLSVPPPQIHAQQPAFEEFQDEAGFYWRRYTDGRLEYFDDTTQSWYQHQG